MSNDERDIRSLLEAEAERAPRPKGLRRTTTRRGVGGRAAIIALPLLIVASVTWIAVASPFGGNPRPNVVGPGPEPSDGRIVFSRFNEPGGIMTMNADGDGAQVIAPTEFAPMDDAAWSPDGTKIAFHGFYGRARNQAGGLFVMNADGSHRRLIARGGGMPTWSPDGGRIAFNKGGTILISSLVGNDQHSSIDVEGEFPDWSPDGDRIAYTTGQGLFLVPAVGGPPDRVGDSSWAEIPTDPQWSPDGTEISVTVYTDLVNNGVPASYIGIVDVESGAIRRLTDGRSPTWSPNGERIAFSRASDRNESHIHSIAVDGTDERQLTTGDVADHSPDWGRTGVDQPAPSETKGGSVVGSEQVVMAFGNEGDIWLALSDGSVVNVTQSPQTEASPTISFDDRVLVYEREGRLVYLRLDTGESAEFARGYSPAFGPVDYLAWDSGAGEIVVGSPFSDWTVRAPNGPRGQGATAFSFAWDQSLELLYYSVAFGHGVNPYYIDVVRVDGWECAECGGGLELGRVRELQPDDGTEGEFLSTSFGTPVDVLRLCCRESDADAWETAEIGDLDPFDTGTVYNRIRGVDDVPLDLSGTTNLGLAHAGSLEATVTGDAVDWGVTDRSAWFLINDRDLWLVTDGRDAVLLPFKVSGGVAVAPTFAGSPLIHSF